MSQLIIGASLPKIPWEEKPGNESRVIWRYSNNPIIKRNPIPSGARAFNSAVLPYNDAYVGVFRVDHNNTRPNLHLGTSSDAIKWELSDPIINWVDEKGNPKPVSYAYDPRLLQIEDTFYIMWCDDFPGPSIGLGKTKDFKTFTRLENATMPFNRNGVLFPRKINGLYAMLSRPSDSGHTPFGDIVLSYSPDLTYWGKHRLVMTSSKYNWWQDTKIGAGPAPIETREGWLLFYHGVVTTCNGFVYSMGASLLDLDDPSKVIYRTRDYILTPEMDYETTGFVPNVVFPCAALVDAPTGRIAIYYGAADTYTAIAFTQVDELMEFLRKNSD
ncbi:MAG: glycoside hydrolase family 130 protein [Deferribacteres bacterium]|nr:glycoside hydrolase family 130 protein [candidate division KSB1 bacterium]MCB9502163.1 glycoside hydrolase family 130 protein [Deferribacteres bacterium]